MRQYHLDLDESDVGRYVLMPGDPHRVSAIAAYLSDAREMSFHREFCTWTGYLGQTRVSVVSSGIGGPSTAIALEELAALGVHTVIRTGTCGLLQPGDTRGVLVIATGCYRGGSTANAYVPINYPAIADFELVEALCTAARSRGVSPRVGVIESKDAFFLESPQYLPCVEEATMHWDIMQRAGILATEMESDTIFVIAQLRKMRAASVLFGLGSHHGVEDMSPMSSDELDTLSRVAIGALEAIIESDKRKISIE